MVKYAQKISSLLVLSVFFILPFFNNNHIFYGTYTVKEVYLCLAAFLAAVLWLPGFLRAGTVKINPYVYVCALFMFLLLLSGIGNPALNRVLYAERSAIWLAMLLLPAAGLLPNFDKITKAAVVSNIPVTIAAIIQGVLFLSGNGAYFSGRNEFGFRIFAVFGNPDLYAAYIVVVIPLIIYAYSMTKKKSILALAVLNAGLMISTQSVSGAGTLSIMAIVWAAAVLKGKRKILAVVIAMLVMSAAAWMITSQKKDSAVMRLFLWDASARMAAAYPLTGAGAGNFRIFSPVFQAKALEHGKYPAYVLVHDEAYAHNDLMQFISETGMAGTAGFLLLLFFPFYVYFGNKNKKPGDSCAAAAMAGVIIFSMANFPFEMPMITAFYMALAFKVTAGAELREVKAGLALKAGASAAAIGAAFSALIIVPDYLARGYLASYMGYAVSKELKVNFGADEKKIRSDYQLSFYAGIMKSREGMYKEAIMYFKMALELFPGFAGAMYNLGNAYYNSSDMENAELYYRKLIDLNRAYVPAYNNLALIEKRNQNYEEAIKLLLEAEKYNPGLLEVNYNLAEAFYLSGNMEKSAEYLRKTLKIKADYQPALILMEKQGFKP